MNALILGMLSVCYLFWKVGHQLLLSLPFSYLRRVLLSFYLLLWSIVLIYLYYVLITSTFFLQCHAAISIPMFGGKTDHPGHLPPQVHIESHFNVNLCSVFFLFLRLIWDILNHLGESQMDHIWLLYFLGNNRQHWPISAETNSSWVRKVLCVAKAHMALCSLWGVATSAALAAGVSLVSILQAGD